MENWTIEEHRQELLNRINYQYRQTDGPLKFPNSEEGDFIKMVHCYLEKETAIKQTENHRFREALKDVQTLRNEMERIANNNQMIPEHHLLLDIPAIKLEVWLEDQIEDGDQ